jgi:two-component system chemotaxis response regulator CheB
MSDPRLIKVLLVDDSATVRELVTQLFRRDPSVQLAVAADPLIAMRKMQQVRPDVILLDMNMPRMDGASFLRKIMAEDPIPVVVFSTTTGDTDAAMRALAEGAVDVVTKPPIGIRSFLEESYTLLADAVRAAASARLPKRRRVSSTPPPSRLSPAPPSMRDETRIVGIGASTGGTEALATILAALPADAPGILVVQHMPAGFTQAFARRLDGLSRVSVKEAEPGDRVARGRVLVAPGNRHLVVRRAGAEYVVEIVDAPLVSRHRPSVDMLFQSMADVAADDAVGVLLTGMGDDGAEGLLSMRQRGAATIAQDAASCVVFGMPREAIARGAVDETLPLDAIAARLVRRAARDERGEARAQREGGR